MNDGWRRALVAGTTTVLGVLGVGSASCSSSITCVDTRADDAVALTTSMLAGQVDDTDRCLGKKIASALPADHVYYFGVLSPAKYAPDALMADPIVREATELAYDAWTPPASAPGIRTLAPSNGPPATYSAADLQKLIDLLKASGQLQQFIDCFQSPPGGDPQACMGRFAAILARTINKGVTPFPKTGPPVNQPALDCVKTYFDYDEQTDLCCGVEEVNIQTGQSTCWHGGNVPTCEVAELDFNVKPPKWRCVKRKTPSNPVNPNPNPPVVECYRYCATFDLCAVNKLPPNHVVCYNTTTPPAGCQQGPNGVMCCSQAYPDDPMNPCK